MSKANNISRSLQIMSRAQGWDPTEQLEGVYEYGMHSGHPGHEHDGQTAPPAEARLAADCQVKPPGAGPSSEVKPPKGADPYPGMGEF
jgi:hypothetical protein